MKARTSGSAWASWPDSPRSPNVALFRLIAILFHLWTAISSVAYAGMSVFATAWATSRATSDRPEGQRPTPRGPALVCTTSPGTRRLAPISTITPCTAWK